MDNFDDLFSDPSEIYGGDFPLRPSSSRLHSRRVLTSPLHLDEPRPIRRQDSLSLSRPHIQLTPPSASFKAEENESKAKYSLFGRNFIALPITPEHGEKLLIPKPNHFLKPVDRKNPLVGVYESRPNVRSGEGYHVVKIRKCPVTWTISDIKSYFHPIQVH